MSAKVARVDFVGEDFRIYRGSPWSQPVIFLQYGDTGQFIGEIIENPGADSWNVKIANGAVQTISNVTAWAINDFVYVQKVEGVWTIVSAVTLEDMSGVTRIRMQIKTDSNGTALCSLDSDNAIDEPNIEISPDADTSFTLNIPGADSDLLVPFVYWYDIWFNSTIRQQGKIEVYQRITQF